MMRRFTMIGAIALLLALGHNTARAQATIAVDGDLSDWTDDMRLDVPPNRPILTWQDGAAGRDNSPADPNDLTYMVDLNFAGLYATDDEENLYVRVDMNPLADVRKVWTDTDMYPQHQRIELYISIDPDLLLDFADTTGMSWGWYFSGVDYSIPLYPIDEAYQDTTGFQVPIAEHSNQGNEWSFAPNPRGGAYVAWNAAHNKVEIAIPKSVLLEPANLENFSTEFVSLWLQSGAFNTRASNEWWQQSATNNDDMLGYIYTYAAPYTPFVPAVEVDGDLSEWTAEMQLDVAPNRPIITWQEGASGRDNSPADPNDHNYMVDLNFADLYATDDEKNLYVRVDMNPLADVRKVWSDTDMYPQHQRIELFLSIDPDLLLDFADTTGMSWGWYFSGVDYSIPLYPINEAYEDTTGYQAAIAEHTQVNNEWAFEPVHPRGGAYVAWNEAYNKVEIAIPKSVLLRPTYMENFSGEYVSLWLQSGAYNTRGNNEWWQQSATNNDDMLGYIYTYQYPSTVAVEPNPEVVEGFVLEQNYPNPFNPSTTISFTMKETAHVLVEVFDVLGRHRATLVDGIATPGPHTVTFSAGDLESGVYLYRVTAGGFSSARTMVLMK